jgi:hypothetical protein
MSPGLVGSYESANTDYKNTYSFCVESTPEKNYYKDFIKCNSPAVSSYFDITDIFSKNKEPYTLEVGPFINNNIRYSKLDLRVLLTHMRKKEIFILDFWSAMNNSSLNLYNNIIYKNAGNILIDL